MKLKIIAWLGLIAMFAGIVYLGYILTNIFSSIIPLIVLGLFAIIVIAVYVYNIFKEQKEKFCSNCKRQYDFDNGVEYHEIETYTKTHHYNPDSIGKQKIESLTYKVGFDCTCTYCGARKSFTKKIYGGAEYSDGSVDLKNPEDTIENYFTSSGLSANKTGNIVVSFIVAVITFVTALLLPLANFDWLSDIIGPMGSDVLEASDYYGTYYGVTDDYTEYRLIISDRRVELRQKGLTEASGSISTYDNQEQVFYSQNYAEKHFETPGFNIYGALVLDESYILWITSSEGQTPKFRVSMKNGGYLELTQNVKTVASITGDPKNYYGTYEYSGNTLKIYENNCYLSLQGSNSNGTWWYVYANEDILHHLGIYGYKKGIIVFKDNNYYWFTFYGTDLLLSGEYLFEKSF